MKNSQPAGRQGFTLIELMIVMVIMGILAVIGITAFISSQIKGRDTTRKGSLQAIAQALELYYNDKGQYPANDVAGSGTFSGCWTVQGAGPGICGKDYPVFKDSITNGAIYMTKFPVDPTSTQRYYYIATKVNGFYIQYQLYTHLENSQDVQIDAQAVQKGYNCASTGTVICNYGISGTNTTP